MGKKFLIDTNVIIYHFKGELPAPAQIWLNKIFQTSFNISIFTKIEFLGWRKYTLEQYEQARNFLNNANVIGLNHNTVEKTIQLRRHLRINLADAIIAATCLINNCALITRNVKDFVGAARLKIIDPFQIDLNT